MGLTGPHRGPRRTMLGASPDHVGAAPEGPRPRVAAGRAGRRQGGSRAVGRMGRARVGKREGGGREERGGEAHLGIQRSAATVHRITPRAREVEEREREVAAREKK
jgi:hypothetical protein